MVNKTLNAVCVFSCMISAYPSASIRALDRRANQTVSNAPGSWPVNFFFFKAIIVPVMPFHFRNESYHEQHFFILYSCNSYPLDLPAFLRIRDKARTIYTKIRGSCQNRCDLKEYLLYLLSRLFLNTTVS